MWTFFMIFYSRNKFFYFKNLSYPLFMTIYLPFWNASLYVHFWKVLPLFKKVGRGTYAYALNLSKGCEEFVLKWLINKSYIFWGDLKHILTFLLLCPLQITFNHTFGSTDNSAKRGELG